MITLNKAGEAVLRRAVKRIEVDPSRWDQGSWANPCGTTACLGGWILFDEAGMNLVDIEGLASLRSDNDIEDAPAKALDLLGITDEADRLRFYHDVFLHITAYTGDDEAVRLRYEPEAFELLKERLTEVTGVTF